MSTSVWVIANARSRVGRSLGASLEEGLQARGYEFELHRTEGGGHAVELAAGAVQAGVDRVLAVGGDGTIHEVANGLLSSSADSIPSLCVLPTGTGNDFYRMVGVDMSVDGALTLLDRGRSVPFDVGLASWEGGSRYFVNLAGVGLDVAILQRRRAFSRLPGKLQYLAAMGPALAGFRPLPVHVELEGLPALDCRALLATMTVGPSVAGGIPLSPNATPFDGMLDFCLVERLGLARLLYYVPKVLRGAHEGLPSVHLHRTRSMRLTSPGGAFSFELDGEVVGESSPWLEVRTAEVRLPVLVSDEVAEVWEEGRREGRFPGNRAGDPG